MKEFQELVKVNTVTKPIAIILCDDGPHQNPQFPKTLDVSIQHFKEFNFNVMFVSTLAPGISVYNNVERRMTPLSKALAGVLLLHDTFGTHLDSQGSTTFVELEKQNFKAVGKLLAEIWKELVLDKFLAVSKYVKDLALDPVPINETWVATHYCISQYFLQIVKCTKWECCGEFKNYEIFLELMNVWPLNACKIELAEHSCYQCHHHLCIVRMGNIKLVF